MSTAVLQTEYKRLMDGGFALSSTTLSPFTVVNKRGNEQADVRSLNQAEEASSTTTLTSERRTKVPSQGLPVADPRRSEAACKARWLSLLR